jgi:hypothetical protein
MMKLPCSAVVATPTMRQQGAPSARYATTRMPATASTAGKAQHDVAMVRGRGAGSAAARPGSGRLRGEPPQVRQEGALVEQRPYAAPRSSNTVWRRASCR